MEDEDVDEALARAETLRNDERADFRTGDLIILADEIYRLRTLVEAMQYQAMEED